MQQKPALIFLALAIVGAAAWFFTRADPQGTALHTREQAARGLAEELGRSQFGAKILVMSNPFTQRPDIAKAIADMEQAGLTGLRTGLGTKATVGAVVFPELRTEAQDNPAALLSDVETTTPLSFLVAPDAFDKLIRQHVDCAVVVSLIGLPVELNRCEAWNAPNVSTSTKFALLLPDFRGIADAPAIIKAVKSGRLLAFVLPKRGAPASDAPLTKDWKAEFERRFVLVTADNVEQVVGNSPELF